MDTGRFRCTKNSAEVVRVLNSIQSDEKWDLTGCLCDRQNVCDIVIGSGRHKANDALMMAAGDQAVERRLRFDVNGYSPLARKLDHIAELPVGGQHEEALQRASAGSKGFPDGMKAIDKVAGAIASTGWCHPGGPLW
jgi:hypothetical protein